MSKLTEYAKKRGSTTEVPAVEGHKAAGRSRLYVLQLHDANKAGLHHDFRYHDGTILKSWCLPKLWPEHRAVARLAIQTEVHPLAWAAFEGTIKEGYGAGTVKIESRGTLALVVNRKDLKVFRLWDPALGGLWELRHLEGNKWLLKSKGE